MTKNQVEDLSEQKFGKLTAIRFYGYEEKGKNKKYKITNWLCKCDCGNEKIVNIRCLKKGNTKSCGCAKFSSKENGTFDLTGIRSGKLVVINFDFYKPNTRGKNIQYWKCLCDCGNEISVARSCLLSNQTKSCGCLSGQWSKKRNIKYNGNRGPTRILPYSEAAWNLYYSEHKNRCKKNNKEFSLSMSEFKELCSNNCKYCGIEANRQFPSEQSCRTRKINGVIIVTGIDRVDSSIGYTINNCVSCCLICNKSKLDMTLQEWENWLDRITKFRGNK